MKPVVGVVVALSLAGFLVVSLVTHMVQTQPAPLGTAPQVVSPVSGSTQPKRPTFWERIDWPWDGSPESMGQRHGNGAIPLELRNQACQRNPGACGGNDMRVEP